MRKEIRTKTFCLYFEIWAIWEEAKLNQVISKILIIYKEIKDLTQYEYIIFNLAMISKLFFYLFD